MLQPVAKPPTSARDKSSRQTLTPLFPMLLTKKYHVQNMAAQYWNQAWQEDR